EMLEVENVEDVHHIHVWALSTTENSMTAHIKLHEMSSLQKTRDDIKTLLRHHDIAHCTLEFEAEDYACREQCS
ncbi:MAG: hypothetical protein IJJ26_01915, partial [Victivallales bacterium]|nr:hypothetical protein [Victivallales bacterium]